MNAALGTAGVALGLAAAVVGAITIVVGLVTGRPSLLRSSRLYVGLLGAGALLAFIAMERALITRDFSLEYVARNGSTRTPALFNFAALWSALEGSIILWALILSGYIAVVVHHFRARLTDPLVGWALATMLAVAMFAMAGIPTRSSLHSRGLIPIG
jgi:cytochrome c-type biogenesis protein CcmF